MFNSSRCQTLKSQPFYFQDPSPGGVRGIQLVELDSVRSFLNDPPAGLCSGLVKGVTAEQKPGYQGTYCGRDDGSAIDVPPTNVEMTSLPTVKGLDRGIQPTIVLFSRRAPRRSQCELPGDAGGFTCSVALPYFPGNNDNDSPTYSPYSITSYPDHA
ncbi:hypothetical protein FSST1_000076 [Fusarium sambucinum]